MQVIFSNGVIEVRRDADGRIHVYMLLYTVDEAQWLDTVAAMSSIGLTPDQLARVRAVHRGEPIPADTAQAGATR